MGLVIAVAAGGAAGSLARYFVVETCLRWWGVTFPWGTLAVNLIGSFAIGLFAEMLASKWPAPELRALIVVGFLGGFTTFSAFSLDLYQLLVRSALGLASLYVAGSVGLGLLAFWLGLKLARAVIP
jgi:fluoride exporter